MQPGVLQCRILPHLQGNKVTLGLHLQGNPRVILLHLQGNPRVILLHLQGIPGASPSPPPPAAQTFRLAAELALGLGRATSCCHCGTAPSSFASQPRAPSACPKIYMRQACGDSIERKAQQQTPPNSQLTERGWPRHVSPPTETLTVWKGCKATAENDTFLLRHVVLRDSFCGYV